MQFRFVAGLVMVLILGLLIQYVNAGERSEQYTKATSACIQQGDAAIANLIKEGILQDKYESMTCEQVLENLKR